jgi:hypothetical protein
MTEDPSLAGVRLLLHVAQDRLEIAQRSEGDAAEAAVLSAAWRIADAGFNLRQICEANGVGGAGVSEPTGRGAWLPGAGVDREVVRELAVAYQAYTEAVAVGSRSSILAWGPILIRAQERAGVVLEIPERIRSREGYWKAKAP